MDCLRDRTLTYVLFGFLVVGCATSSFRVLNQTKSATEFIVTPDRVTLECEKVEKDDKGIVYGFMIHVLDDKKTSFTLAQTNSLDKESCDYRINKIRKILNKVSRIYLVGVGYYQRPRKTGLNQYTFPRVGTFEDNGRSLQFIAIKNEHNQCYGAFTGEELPCPPEPFPIKK